MKKTLAILLALAMVFSTLTVAFAEGTLSTDAQACVTLGMLKGDTSAGVTADYVATAPKRIQAALLFLRLKGLEPAALAFTGTDNFADADQAAWAKPVMAYLKANPQLGFNGVGNNNFDPNGLMTASSYYKVVLTALGYKQSEAGVVGDFAWENVLAFAESKGLKNVAAVTNFTVNDLAIATIEGLKATVKDTTTTLAAQLIEQKAITEAQATEAGVYTPVPEKLAVESVKAINLKETVVTFNKEVDKDSAEDVDNYLLDDEDMPANTDISLNADKKSVTITWADASILENQTEYDLTVDGVTDVDGTAIEEVTVTFTANDVTVPVAEDLKLIGPNKMKLTFSEPIAALGDITVEDKDFDYEVVEPTLDGSNEVIVELSDEELAVGDYTVTVKGFEDYAGLKNLTKKFTLAYAKDTTAPVATIKSATQTKVVVDFNKPVYNGEAGDAQQLDENFFYHTYSSYEPVLVVPNADNDEFTVYFTVDAAVSGEEMTASQEAAFRALDLTDRPLPEGAVKFVVVADGDDNITDEWGNELDNNVSFNLSIASDVTAPKVTKIDVVDQNTVDVYFSEDVAIDSADDPSDYFTLVDKDGEDVDINDLSYSNADDEYIATLSFDAGNELEGDYTLTVQDVKDLALEANEIAKATEKFTVADETAPDLTDVTVIGVEAADQTDADTIYVTFPEDMATSGAYSVLDKDNYQLLVGGQYKDLRTDDKIVTFKGNDKVKITLAKSTNYTNYNVEDRSVQLVIGRVADALGNKVTEFGPDLAITVDNETQPDFDTVTVLDEKTIEIVINGELKSVNKSYIEVSHKGDTRAPLYAIKSWKLDDGQTIITGILKASQYADDPSDTNYTVYASVGDEFETIQGTTMTVKNTTSIDDGYAPSITDVDDIAVPVATGGVFTINFDESLATGAIVDLYAQDLVVKNADGDVLVAGVDYKTTVGDYLYAADADNVVNDVMTNGQLIITLQNTTKAKVVGNYKVYSNSTIKYIQDGAGNEANAFTTSTTLHDLR